MRSASFQVVNLPDIEASERSANRSAMTSPPTHSVRNNSTTTDAATRPSRTDRVLSMPGMDQANRNSVAASASMPDRDRLMTSAIPIVAAAAKAKMAPAPSADESQSTCRRQPVEAN